MRIKELRISEFGSLKDKKVTLGEGLNVIEGENESGKSTLVLFIKFMLYGLGRRSSKNIDRERAFSFDGHRAAGSILLECDGNEYLIERRAALGVRQSETVTFTNMSTGESMRGEPGEVLLGVPYEVFESSAYVSQMKASAVENSQTTSQIENMLVSADENIDVSRILEKIDKVRKEYRLNRGEGGKLYEAERELSSLRQKQREATEKHLRISEMAARHSRLEASIGKVEESYHASKQMLDDLMGAKILQRFFELDAKEAELSALESTEEELEEGIRRDGFVPDRTHVVSLHNAAGRYAEAKKRQDDRRKELDSMPSASEEDTALALLGKEIEASGGKTAFLYEVNSLDKKAGRKRGAALAAIALGIALCAVAIVVLNSFLPSIGVLAIAAAVLACGVSAGAALLIGALGAKKSRDALCEKIGVPFAELDGHADACLASLARLRAREGVRTGAMALYASAEQDANSAYEALASLLYKTLGDTFDRESVLSTADEEYSRLCALCKKREELAREIYAKSALVESIRSELEPYDREKLAAEVHTDISALTPEAVERARTKERFDKERLDKLYIEERAVRETLIALRAADGQSPVELADKIEVLEKKYKGDMAYYNALMLAKEHIERASTAMTAGVTPDISRRASELMRILSGGMHDTVQTSKALSLSLSQDGFFVASELLSGGTRDAAYICLRIALMGRIFGENVPPLVLDEALCQLDDTRASRLLVLLSGLSESMQTILLTCHSREMEICKKSGLDFCKIELK